MIFPEWTVIRSIPHEFWTGLITGEYNLTGGVIRHAAGTELGGQIVAHLLPAGSALMNIIPGLNFIPGLVTNFQLNSLGQKMETLAEMTQLNSYRLMQLSGQVKSLSEVTHQVLGLAAGTAVLSGLGLAVSCIGFPVLNKKLKAIDRRLQEVQDQIHAVREFLEISERAELKAALADLLKIGKMNNENHRDRIINDRRQSLMKLNEKYKELLENSNTLETAIANEEYFSLTGIAYARCTAELGMLDIACEEMEDIYNFWKQETCRVTNNILLGKHPERFLANDFAADVPISALAGWLDFAYCEEKGYAWIDELRGKSDHNWYGRKLSFFAKKIGVGIEKEKTCVIPTLQKFLHRNNIFDGYLAQYKSLESYQMKPSEFEQKTAELPEENAVDGYYIMQKKKPGKKWW